MDTQVSNGVVESPVSHENSKYAEYFEMNREEGEGSGNPESQKPEVKPEEKAEPKPSDPAQEASADTKDRSSEEKQRIPHWQKSINKLTAQKKQLEEQLKAVQESKAKQSPEYTRDNFVDDKEYQAWLKNKLKQEIQEELTMSQLAERTKAIDAEKLEYETEMFRQSWAQKVNNCYSSQDPQEYQTFVKISQDQKFLNSLPDVVHDFMEGSDVAPVIMHVLYLRPDKVEEIARARPINQTKLLMKLEADIEVYARQSSPQTSTQQPARQVSRAPKPIGTVNVSGQSLTEDESDDVAYASYLKKKFGR